jgi:beta-lactamase superfamily II metal-dependent hydrolase
MLIGDDKAVLNWKACMGVCDKSRMRSLGATRLVIIGSLLGTVLGIQMLAPLASAQTLRRSRGNLQIYFVDVEGGQATLFVMPHGQSLLIDTGFAGHRGRDADRIVAAARMAGLRRLDYVLITHYHGDHVGGVPELSERIPIGTFFDHGPNREVEPEKSRQSTKAGYDAYQKLLATMKYKHTILHAGDRLPIKDIDAMVVSGDGSVIEHPLPGAGATNPSCGATDQPPVGLEGPDLTENGRSLAIVIQFGHVRILDAGDLTWDRERMLMCPANMLGHVNLFIVGNHGMMPSTSPALVNGIAPQVAIMDNGSTKGGTVRVLDLIRDAPSRPVLWQLHYAKQAGTHNTATPLIANLVAPSGQGTTQTDDNGFMLKVTVNRNGRFTVMNNRTGEAKEYIAR